MEGKNDDKDSGIPLHHNHPSLFRRSVGLPPILPLFVVVAVLCWYLRRGREDIHRLPSHVRLLLFVPGPPKRPCLEVDQLIGARQGRLRGVMW